MDYKEAFFNMKRDYILSAVSVAEKRYRACKSVKDIGVCRVANIVDVDRRTINRWMGVFEGCNGEGEAVAIAALKNKSRLGQPHKFKTPKEIIDKILKYRKKTGHGARLIKFVLGLNESEKTINKILKANGYIAKKEPKPRKKTDMTQYRESIPPFRIFQIDIKYLCDISPLIHNLRYNKLPQYQITARDYKSGLTFIGFAHHKDSTSVGIFVAYVINQLKIAGTDTSNTIFQSDNGSEFRPIFKKHGYSLYEEILRLHGVNYKFNPVARPTYNSDVESFHNRIEKEFYNIEEITCQKTMLYKSWMYMVWYNKIRPNRNKNNMAPAQILKQYEEVDVDLITATPPVFVDHYIKDIEKIKNGTFKWSPVIEGEFLY